jgi:hypothetical protein
VELRKRAVTAVCMSTVLLGAMAFAGCDDNSVEIQRDPSVHFAKGMTWAWRPVNPPPNQAASNDNRPVTSRDVISQAPPPQLESNRDWNTEANRDQMQKAIEKGLKSKGLTQVNDPNAADFLVDYHVAVRSQHTTVGTVYPGWGWGWWGWGGWGWGPPEVEYRNVAWHEGTFVLDVSLRNPHKLAYRAVGQKELSHKTQITPYQADEAVGHLLKGLKVQ